MAKFKETSVAAIFQNQVEKYGDRACVAYKKDGVYTEEVKFELTGYGMR